MNLIRVMPAEGSAMTQLESARRGTITPEMRRVAVREGATAETIRDEVARGRSSSRPTCAISPAAAANAPSGRPLDYPTSVVGHPGADDAAACG
jgi:hypothetical protein